MDDFEPVPQPKRPPTPEEEEKRAQAQAAQQSGPLFPPAGQGQQPAAPRQDAGGFPVVPNAPLYPQPGNPAIPPQQQQFNPAPPQPQPQQQFNPAIPPQPQTPQQANAQEKFAQMLQQQSGGFSPAPQPNYAPEHYQQSPPAQANFEAIPAQQAQAAYAPQESVQQFAAPNMQAAQEADDAALQAALHSHDDDDDDDDDEEEDDQSRTRQFDLNPKEWTIVDPPAAGIGPLLKTYWKHYQTQARFIIMKPQLFFEAMPQKGVAADATKFLGTSALFFSFAYAALHVSPLDLFTRMTECMLSTGVGALIAGLALPRLGGKGSLEATYAVFAYSRITYVLAWVVVGPLPVGGVAAMAYSVYLNIMGLQRVHGLERKMLAAFCCCLAIIGMAFRMRFPM